MLAKLLAKENIRVRFGNYSTAFFEPKQRILGLPKWNAESKQVSDLLVGHEVGHALYTPVDGIDRFRARFPGVPFDICNVIEDVRIERIIQSTYPGLVHSFRSGYSSFVAKDLFKIAGVDLKTLSAVDRINLQAKIGHLVVVPLSPAERKLYDMSFSAETFDDVLDICEMVIELVKSEKSEKPKAPAPKKEKSQEKSKEQTPGSSKSDDQSGEDGEGDDDEGDGDSDASDRKSDQESDSDAESDTSNKSDAADDDDESDKSSDGDKSDGDKSKGKPDVSEDEDDFEPDYNPDANYELTSTSHRALDENLKGMQDDGSRTIVNTPTASDIMSAVSGIEKVMTERRKCPLYDHYMCNPQFLTAYSDFKRTTKTNVAVLVKEFERRKAAFQYSRAQRATTGSIDVNRLHSYKFEDQLFKSVTHLADAKNHGMVFFIDYSGSMNRTIRLVIEQTIQLVTFCKAVNIPFEVYGFTSKLYNYTHGESSLCGSNLNLNALNVFQILNSDCRKSEYELCIKELYAMAYHRKMDPYTIGTMHVLFSTSTCETFGGTPLCETVIAAHEIVRRFQRKHNVQRTNVMFLTDGDPCELNTYDINTDKEYRKNTEKWAEGWEMDCYGSKIIHKRKDTRHTYGALIRSLRKATGATIIGYFIADSQRYYKSHCIDAIRNSTETVGDWTKAAEAFQKRGSAARRNGVLDIPGGYGYDMLFAFDTKCYSDMSDADDEFESELDVADNFGSASSQNKLAKEFTKYAADKKSSRVFLNKFSELIA